jgi:hypothetical protein
MEKIAVRKVEAIRTTVTTPTIWSLLTVFLQYLPQILKDLATILPALWDLMGFFMKIFAPSA